MYSVNGIDLPSSQYRELCDLVALDSDEKRVEFSKKALNPYEDKTIWNPNGLDCYKGLYKKGLIDGTPAMNAFLFYGVVTQAGIDFVRDYEALQKQERLKIWSDRRFQIGLSLATLVISTTAGWIAGHIS